MAPVATVSVKFPSKSEMVPLVVPFSMMEAPMIGNWSVPEMIVPLTESCCAWIACVKKANRIQALHLRKTCVFMCKYCFLFDNDK